MSHAAIHRLILTTVCIPSSDTETLIFAPCYVLFPKSYKQECRYLTLHAERDSGIICSLPYIGLNVCFSLKS